MSFSADCNYIRTQGSLLPFLFFERYETLLPEPYSQFQSLSSSNMNPLGIYLDKLQSGLSFSSSISFNQTKYNVLLEGNFHFIDSKQHENRQFLPKYELNSIITVHIVESVNLISNWFFVGNRDALIINQVYNIENPFDYVTLPSYIDGNLSLNYNFDAMIISLDLKNILGHRIEFFDRYYDDDGFKISLGFSYKF